jgi:hypothetical protein
VLDLLPFAGTSANAENSQMALKQARDTYAAALTALTTQLGAL